VGNGLLAMTETASYKVYVDSVVGRLAVFGFSLSSWIFAFCMNFSEGPSSIGSFLSMPVVDLKLGMPCMYACKCMCMCKYPYVCACMPADQRLGIALCMCTCTRMRSYICLYTRL